MGVGMFRMHRAAREAAAREAQSASAAPPVPAPEPTESELEKLTAPEAKTVERGKTKRR